MTRHHRASGAGVGQPAPTLPLTIWPWEHRGEPTTGRPSHWEIGRVRGRFRGKSVGSTAPPRTPLPESR
jgi:hypothetical protein